MKLELKKRPKKVTILEGFPGFGLVSTITTEYLVDHLNAELIGRINVTDIPPVVAVHDSKVIQPVGIFYSKKNNLVILHALTSVKGLEWGLAEQILELAKLLDAKEIVSVEGISNPLTKSRSVYYLANQNRSISKLGLGQLKEGVVIGVTGALLLKESIPIVSLFAETASGLPDSRAAANVIKALDSYLGLKIDYKPLLRKAEDFEKKIKQIVTKNKEATDLLDQKDVNYLG